MSTFSDFNINEQIIHALSEQGIQTPTEVQEKVIPIALNGDDVVAKAPTGTGKTLSFVLPIMEKVDRESNKVQAIIICPTRELVIQICDVFKMATKYYESFRVAGVYGGQNFQRQLMFLRKKPQVIVGTPGRIIDHLNRHTLKLQENKILVLDEGDEMFDMGFRDDIETIMKAVPQLTTQKMLFSATIPNAIKTIVEEKFKNPKFVETTIQGETIPQIKQYYTMVKDSQRVAALLYIKKENNFSRCIVFCNTKSRADKLYQALIKAKQNVAVIHSDIRQNERIKIMKGFKEGQIEMLVATDVAARGIDVDEIKVIFNFDPPSDSDFYVHRIGRTARANKTGVAYTIIDSSQVGFVQAYQTATQNALEYIELPELKGDFTLPKDGSNKFHKLERGASSKRFFLNVGKVDMLDNDALAKLVCTKCNVQLHEIVDIKVANTYSFIELGNDKANNIKKLEGLVLGKRKVVVEEAKKEPTVGVHTKKDFKAKTKNDSKPKDKKPQKKTKKIDFDKPRVYEKTVKRFPKK
ncbi:MAG: DEAD/DEAH box helicase [Clostridiales bacterium]|nr:DEAD/DEAH box helicase [Clostridiales bacterium]